MIYNITHLTHYTYSQPVALDPHLIQLRPRSDAFQTVQEFSLEVFPQPLGLSHCLGLDGNNVIKIWFSQPTEELKIKVNSQVETHCTNPFHYLLEPWAMELPIVEYPSPVLSHLQPYLQKIPDPIIIQLAQEIWHKTQGQTLNFLSELNQKIHDTCQHIIRPKGRPLPPGLTWTQQFGSCRDLTVVFMEACRMMNLATRFVSGYQEGNLNRERRDLHAWAEVYLPGAGWRGYDPTQGLAISDRHIPLVATAIPRHAAPIKGTFRGIGATSQMEFHVSIAKIEG